MRPNNNVTDYFLMCKFSNSFFLIILFFLFKLFTDNWKNIRNKSSSGVIQMKTSHYTTFLYDYTGRPIQGDCYTTLNNNNQLQYFPNQNGSLKNSIKDSDIAANFSYEQTRSGVKNTTSTHSVANEDVRIERDRKSKLFLTAATTTEVAEPTAFLHITGNDNNKQNTKVLNEQVTSSVIKNTNSACCIKVDKQPQKGSKRKLSRG
jgi:hypothetical protein